MPTAAKIKAREARNASNVIESRCVTSDWSSVRSIVLTLYALYGVQSEVFDMCNDADDLGVRIVFAVTCEVLAKRLLIGELLTGEHFVNHRHTRAMLRV